MPTTLVLLLIAPFLLLVAVSGIVVIVALCRAKPEDIPSVLPVCVGLFRRLMDGAPGTRRLRSGRPVLAEHPDDEHPDEDADEDADEEDTGEEEGE